VAFSFQAPADGTIDSASVYGNASNGELKVAIYDGTETVPGSLLARQDSL
jgi:hypothetical protein